MALPVRDGKLEYPGADSDLVKPRQFTVEQFKDTVRTIDAAASAAAKRPEMLANRTYPLEKLVPESTLIVRCRTERVGEKVFYQVLEVWKGKFDQKRFARPAPEGHFDFGADIPGVEMVMFFVGKEPIRRYDMFLPVRLGKVNYRGSEQEVEKFRQRILDIDKQSGRASGAG